MNSKVEISDDVLFQIHELPEFALDLKSVTDGDSQLQTEDVVEAACSLDDTTDFMAFVSRNIHRKNVLDAEEEAQRIRILSKERRWVTKEIFAYKGAARALCNVVQDYGSVRFLRNRHLRLIDHNFEDNFKSPQQYIAQEKKYFEGWLDSLKLCADLLERAELSERKGCVQSALQRSAILKAVKNHTTKLEISFYTIEKMLEHFPQTFRTRAFNSSYSRFKAQQSALVDHNQRLVIHIAAKFNHRGMELVDLMQEGNLGLLKAIERFDSQRDVRFSTYAYWWIEQSVRAAMTNQRNTIRLPTGVSQGLAKINWLKQQEFQARGSDLSNEKLADALGTSEEKIDTLLGLKQSISLSSPINNEDRSLLDTLSSDEESITDQCAKTEKRKLLLRLLEELPERDANIIRMRFGIGVNRDCTLLEIATQTNLSRERIRQIIEDGTQKLRSMVKRAGEGNCMFSY